MNPKQPPRPLLPKAEPDSSSSSPTLDSIPANGVTLSKRRCVSSACMPCRRRKSKCDGVQPSCNACTSVYGSQCYYDIDSDHRRKGALKRDIAQLTEEKEARSIILDAIRNGSESDVDDIVQLIRANPDESFQSIADGVQKMSLHAAKAAKKPEPPTLESALEDNSGKPEFHRTGETLHYGHTSNFSLAGDNDMIHQRTMEQFGTWTNVTSDEELIRHLFGLYFSWSHPFYTLFSEEVFFHGLNYKKLKYCTPLLVNAILAMACNWSDRPDIRTDPNDPSTAGDLFFAEAKRLLEVEERSCLTTVQALGLMSLREAKMNHDSAGWRYAGQMMSMVIELGLHLSYGAQPNFNVTPTEIEARRVTFWGCFAAETAWAFCIGRISALPRTAIRLEKPVVRENLESKLWKPHGDPRFPRDSRDLEQPGHRYNILLQLSTLNEIVDDIVHMFYAPRDRITSRRLQQHHERFRSWYRNLPECLAIKKDSPTLPQVITLHVYYHSCILHLFRPFLKVSFVQSAKTPRQICTEAANTISQLVTLYSTTYGVRRVYFMTAHCITSAAIIHLVNISGPHPSPAFTEQSTIYLADAIRGLGTMLQAFPIVIRCMRAIRILIEKWLPVIPERINEAMIDAEMPSAGTCNPSLSLRLNASGQNIGDHDAPLTNGTSIPNHDQEYLSADRKHSAPELISPSYTDNAHNQNNKNIDPSTPGGESTPNHQQYFWTPFPDNLEGVPLVLQIEDRNQHMDITSMLDSGIDGDWAQLNRDGFTMGRSLEGVIMGEDAGAQLWDVNWDGNI